MPRELGVLVTGILIGYLLVMVLVDPKTMVREYLPKELGLALLVFLVNIGLVWLVALFMKEVAPQRMDDDIYLTVGLVGGIVGIIFGSTIVFFCFFFLPSDN